MRETILAALTTKFPGVAAAILGRIADKLSKTATTAEQAKTVADGVTFQQVIESYADSRATEASETARKNAIADYEKKYSLKDGAKVTDTQVNKEPPAPQPTGGSDEVPAWAKALIDQNKELKERLDKRDAETATETRKQQLQAITGKLPESLRKAYDRIDPSTYTPEQFSGVLADIEKEVDVIAKEANVRGAVFGTPQVGNAGNQDGKLSEDQIKDINARPGSEATGGQALYFFPQGTLSQIKKRIYLRHKTTKVVLICCYQKSG